MRDRHLHLFLKSIGDKEMCKIAKDNDIMSVRFFPNPLMYMKY